MLDARLLRTGAIAIAVLVLAAGIASTFAIDSSAFAHPAFVRTWERTDKPVEDGHVSRSWIWGSMLSGGMQESYSDSPGSKRLVQYFDKARMEITHPDAVDDGLWFVTTGLLVNELVTGQMQVGDAVFLSRAPAEINIAGDPGNDDAPTYADLAAVIGNPPRADGELITQRMDGSGQVSNDPTLAVQNITSAYRVQADGIDHQVASVFWDFMNAQALVWQDGAFGEAALFPNPFYATGFPITEAYWSHVLVGGVPQDVLWQCFQRRCMTYAPANAAGWQVEFGNVGLHYYVWRYDDDPNQPTPTATAPVPTPEPTATSAPLPTTDQLYLAQLSGENVLGDVITDGSAAAWFHVSADGQTVRYRIPVSKLEYITTAQLRLGDDDENGPVVVTLFDGRGAAVTPPRLLVEGSFDAGDLVGPLDGAPLSTLLAAFSSGDAYVTINTSQYPTGEVRGQVGFGTDVLLRADLSGDSLPDPVATDAAGVAVFYYDASAGTLGYQLRVRNLDRTTQALITMDDAATVVATLYASDGDSEDDGVLTTGQLVASDLGGPLAGASLGRLVYELISGDATLKLTTLDEPDGQIGGQVYHWTFGNGTIEFAADLDGRNQPSPVLTSAEGAALFRWEPDGDLQYELVVAETDDPVAAHIHLGQAGANGPVVVTLFLGSEGAGERNGLIADGDIDPEDLSGPLGGRPLQRLVYALATGEAYVNVHTVAHPDGEIRGQAALVDGAIWVAHLRGINQVPPVATSATGVALFELRPSGASIAYRIIVDDLDGAEAATLHLVTNNQSGPTVVRLWEESAAYPAISSGLLIEDVFDDANLVGPLTGSSLQMLVSQIPEGEVYVNIVTAEHPLGEIRGTLE
ncbi:MAG: hypothetical protein DCC58_01830 [Chloroflexi bacterium]|nr:MAG: hypothetical protein DCC58_01830 [Chloroflexota bacterium]